MTHVRTRLWRAGVLEQENLPFDEISEFLGQPDCLVWADLCSPESAHLGSLAEELGLERHAIEDAVSLHERPKASRLSTHLFVTASALVQDDSGVLGASRVSAFTLGGGFFTVRLDDRLDIDAVVRRWDDNPGLLRFGPRALMHGLLDEIVDGYFEAIGSLDEKIDAIEDILFDERAKQAAQLQRQTFTLRKSLTLARRVVLPMREVVNAVRRFVDDAPNGNHGTELAPYYEDLYDHVLRASEWTESLRDMIATIFETNMALSDNRMNQVMKKLTAWAAIIAVPTAITGFFGQNVPYPGFGQSWGFVLSLAVIVLVAVGLYASFRRRDWL